MYLVVVAAIALGYTCYAIDQEKPHEDFPNKGYALFQKIDLSSTNGIQQMLSSIRREEIASLTNREGHSLLRASIDGQFAQVKTPRDLSDSARLTRFASQSKIARLIITQNPKVSDSDMEELISKRKELFSESRRKSYDQSRLRAEHLFRAAVQIEDETLASDEKAKAIRENLGLLAMTINLCCDRTAVIDALIHVHDEKTLSDEHFGYFITLLAELYPPEHLPRAIEIVDLLEKIHNHTKQRGLNCNAALVQFITYFDQHTFINPRANARKINLEELDKKGVKSELRQVTLAEAINAIDFAYDHRISFYRIVDHADNPGEVESHDVRAFLKFSKNLIKFVRASIEHAKDPALMYQFWFGVYIDLNKLNDLNSAFCIARALNLARSKEALKQFPKIKLPKKAYHYRTYHDEINLRLQKRHQTHPHLIPSIIVANELVQAMQDYKNLFDNGLLNHDLFWNVYVAKTAFNEAAHRNAPVMVDAIPNLVNVLMHLPQTLDHQRFADIVALIGPRKKRRTDRFSVRLSKSSREKGDTKNK